MGDLGIFEAAESKIPVFGEYADLWLKDHAGLVCKSSTVDGYKGVLRQYLRPRFALRRLDEVKRRDVKDLIGDMADRKLARSTMRNA